MAATQGYRALFDRAPIAVWEEDFTEARAYIDRRLREEGKTLERLFGDAPEELAEVAARIRITDANEAALRLFEVPSVADFISGYPRFFHEETMPAFLDFIQKVASGERFSDQNIEIVVRTFTGRKLYIDLSWSTSEPTASGFHRLWFFARDINSRVQVQQALRESEHHLLESQRVANIGSYQLDFVAGCWTSSAVLDAIFGIDDTWERVIDGWAEIIHPEDRERMVAYFQDEVIGLRRPFDREYRIRRISDRETRWVSGLGELVCDSDGNLSHMIGTIRDITERKRDDDELQRYREHLEKIVEKRSVELERANEQLLQAQKMEAIGTLAGGVAHDFNNLLATIGGTAELLLHGVESEAPMRARLERVVDACDRGKSLTMQLLTFARKEKLHESTTSLNQIALNIVDLLQGGVGKHIRIDARLDPDLPSVRVDINQITQAVLNICLNACDAMPDGGTLTFRTYRTGSASGEDEEPILCVLEISDTGSGIDESILDNIFDPFFTTKPQGKGTGLGLSVALGIIRNHQGRLELESQRDRGTIVTVRLPGRHHHEVPESIVDQDIGKSTRGVRILVVDDDLAFVDMMLEALAFDGHEVISCTRGDQALELFRSRHQEIELVILDMLMPEMDGVQVFGKMLEIEPAVRVVLCSGYSVEGRASELLASGAKGYLQKPFEIAELRRVIHEAVER